MKKSLLFLVYGCFLALGLAPAAQAANYVFPGTLPAGCSGAGPTYTCGALSLGNNDTVTINGSKPATITINGNFYTNNAVINNAGTAADLTIVASGTLSTRDNVVIKANVQAATINNNTNAAQFGGNVTATSGNVLLAYQTTVTGTVTSGNGSITMGNEAVIGGDVISTGGGAVNVKYKSRITGSVTTTGAVTLENQTQVGGSVNGGTGAIEVNYQAQVTGSVISSTGTILMDNESVAGACVKSTGSAAITLNYHSNVTGVCCGSSCGNSCVTNNSAYTMPAACAPAQSCIVDDFATGTLNPSLWNPVTLGGGFQPQVVDVSGQKRLRMTTAGNNQATLVQLKKWFPGAGNKIVVQFDHYAYGGNGADGVGIVFSDASVPPAPGADGGSLGYAQKSSVNGYAGGWLGVGIDEYGNFPNPTEGRVGYPAGWTPPAGAAVAAGFYANSVSVRGSGSGTTGYRLLANSGTLSPVIWNSSKTSASVQKYRITIDNSNSVNAYVSVERDSTGTGSSYATVIPTFDVRGTNSGQAVVPANWLVSFTGGTGGSTNIHELANISICATYINDPGGSTNASAFDCLETGTSTTWSPTASATTRPLYTKLTSTNFAFDVAALKTDGSLESNYVAAGGNTKYVQVELFDNVTPAATCSAYSSPVATQIVPFASGVYSGAAGRAVTGNFNVATARAKLICRVRECTSSTCSAYSTSVSPACSTDQFSVRPQQLTVSAPVQTNTAITGNPKDLAGNNFTLNASSGVTSGYTGTPTIDSSKVVDHNDAVIASGTMGGSFSAATGVQATGTTFTYRDVGTIRFQADAVMDSTFTAIDQTNSHCVTGSTSNTLSGGKYGCNIGSAQSARMGRWVPSHFSFAGTLTPFCAAGGFTYMNQDSLGVLLTLKAHAKSAVTASASDPVVSRYTTGYTNLAPVTLSGDNSGAAVAAARLTSPAFPTMPNTSLWSAGVFTVNDVYAFSKLGNADGPYDSFKIKAAISDPDGSSLIGTTNETGTTRIRYGRLRMQNAYGSELLDLPVPFEAQYWTGAYYATNTLDSCTALPMNSIVMSNFTGGLAACETQITPTGAQTLANGRIPGGLVLTRPGPTNSGSVDLAINVTNAAVPGAITCVGPASTAATAANLPWFGPNIGGRATFGIYRSPLIYLRENY
jgi:MSHA biogenesis protein MshQ